MRCAWRDHSYLVTDLTDTDLHQIISSPQALCEEHYQYFLYQVRARARRGFGIFLHITALVRQLCLCCVLSGCRYSCLCAGAF